MLEPMQSKSVNRFHSLSHPRQLDQLAKKLHDFLLGAARVGEGALQMQVNDRKDNLERQTWSEPMDFHKKVRTYTSLAGLSLSNKD